MGSIKRKIAQSKDNDWQEYTLTEAEAAFVKTIVNTRNIVSKSYDEMVGRFLGASLVPRVGRSGSMQFDIDPDDPAHKVRIKPMEPIEQES